MNDDILDVETYAVFTNTDSSIVEINETIEKFGYEFILVKADQLEKEFSDLFRLRKSMDDIRIEVTSVNILYSYNISQDFYKIISSDPIFRYRVVLGKEIIFLKKKENFQLGIRNGSIDIELQSNAIIETNNYADNLVKQLRLFKKGAIHCPMIFNILKESRKLVTKHEFPVQSVIGEDFCVSGEDKIPLSVFLKRDFIFNSLTELAINNFNLVYEIRDVKTKYITFMTCLESLFNQGKDQIAHTASRHLALIISSTKDEFLLNYKRGKELYDVRSKIVHGTKIKENLNEITSELEDKVRKAINYCINLNISKEKLFEQLNAKGFEN